MLPTQSAAKPPGDIQIQRRRVETSTADPRHQTREAPQRSMVAETEPRAGKSSNGVELDRSLSQDEKRVEYG